MVMIHKRIVGQMPLAIRVGHVFMFPTADVGDESPMAVMPVEWALEWHLVPPWALPLPPGGDCQLVPCVCGKCHWLPLVDGPN